MDIDGITKLINREYHSWNEPHELEDQDGTRQR